MTCIIGYVNDKKIVLGGDRQSTAEDGTKITRLDSKVFEKQNILFGVSESHKINQVIRYNLIIPERTVPVLEYMSTVFINSIYNLLCNNNCTLYKNNQSCGVEMIIGIEGQLFAVDQDYHIIQQIMPFYAIGSGRSFASGSMLALENYKHLTPEERIEISLTVTSKLCATVGPSPFDFVDQIKSI